MSHLRGSERGSMPLALLAGIVVTGLVTVLFAAVMSAQRNVRFDRSFTEVLAHADSGVERAYFLIRQDAIELDVGDPPIVVPDSDGLDYTASITRLDSRTYEVESTGTVAGVDRTVVATVVDEPLFYPGAFADQLIGLNGASTKVDSYESVSSDADCGGNTDPDKCWGHPGGTVGGTGNASVGSNGDLDFSGNVGVGRAYLYDWANYPGENPTTSNPGGHRCDGNPCTAEVLRIEQEPIPYSSDEAMQFIVDKLARCDEVDGTGRDHWLDSEVIDGSEPLVAWSELASDNQGVPKDASWNNFWCATSLEFVGDTGKVMINEAAGPDSDATTDTPVVIFVHNSVKADGPHTDVNCPDCEGRNDRPKAAELQIYVASDSPSGGGDIFFKAQSKFAGVIYAPRAKCGGSGNAGVEIYGAMICGTMSNVGNWEFHYDDTLNDVGAGLYSVAEWREEPGGS